MKIKDIVVFDNVESKGFVGIGDDGNMYVLTQEQHQHTSTNISYVSGSSDLKWKKLDIKHDE